MGTKSFKELIVWQKARDLAVATYKLTEFFPRSELYGLSDQMRRAAVSISSNVAESYHCRSDKEKRRFIAIAFNSGAELESQIEIAKVLYPDLDYRNAESLLGEVMKILNKFLQ